MTKHKKKRKKKGPAPENKMKKGPAPENKATQFLQLATAAKRVSRRKTVFVSNNAAEVEICRLVMTCVR